MDLGQLIRLAITASILLLVSGLGLRATAADATYLFRRPALLLRALLAINVVVPVVAAVLAALLDLTPAVKVALLAMAVSPVPPILSGKQLKLGGRASYAHGLLVAASLAAIVLVPLAIEVLGRLFQREAHIGVAVVAKLVGVTVLLPLVAGLAVRRLAPALAERVAPWVSRLGTLLLLGGLLPLLVSTWPGIVSLVGNGTVLVMATVAAAGLAAGHWLGGPDPDDRTALALAASMRHPGVALAIARANFPEETLGLAAVLLFLVVSVIVTLPYGARRRRRHAERARGVGETR
jgi:BASS family bile acid:Na+ symporter